jgi:hypothetical protein
VKDVGLRGLANHSKGEQVDTTVALIQALIPLGLQAAGEALKAEVTHLAGPRHSRTEGMPGYVRWCRQRGSIYLLDQKLPITYQRVRDLPRNQEVPLATYQGLQLSFPLPPSALRLSPSEGELSGLGGFALS